MATTASGLPRSLHRHTPSYSSTASGSNQSPRGSLFDPTDFSSHSLRLASSHAARSALPNRQPTTAIDMHHSHRRTSRPSTLHRVASSIRRLTSSPSPTDDDWTVFGEAMVHDSAPPLSSSPAHAPLSLSLPIPGGETGYSSRWTHSPVSDLHHDEHFPPPAEVAEEDEEEEWEGRRSDDGGCSSSTGRHAMHTNEDSDTEPPSASLKDTIRDDSKPAGGAGRGLLSRVPALPTLYRNILKCSLAYFLGSLFTYYAPLSRLIVELTQDGPGEKYPSAAGHMVATVAVYYNPAKTIGGMLEADIYCVMGLGFASVISLGSMYTYWALEPHAGWEWLADSLVLIWIFVGMSLVAWFKIWIAKPTFNPAASMTSIILFVVVVKEGGVETLLQVALLVAIGACVSNLVCVTLWPQSAKKNLQANMVKTLDSFSTLLSLLTGTFLLDDEFFQPSQEKISKAVADHQAAFTGLKKNLDEARSERLCGGPTTLLHLNGLRSGTSLQYDLAKAHRDGKLAIRRRPSYGKTFVETKGKAVSDGRDDTEEVMLRAAAAMFGDLVGELESPLQALSSTCTRAIGRLREIFSDQGTSADAESVLDESIDLANVIQRALYEFDSTSNHTLLRLYHRVDVSAADSHASMTSADDNPNPFLSGSDSEHVFLVYFFIFTLQEFSRELISLTVAMSRIYAAEHPSTSSKWYSPVSSALSSRQASAEAERAAQEIMYEMSRVVLTVLTDGRATAGMLTKGRSRIAYSFPKVRPHAPDTVQTPSRVGLSAWRRFQLSLWTFGGRLQDHDVKYAIKTGMATAILAAPAFIDATRPTFMEYRGEWALISFFVVMSPTIGATNFLSVHRVLGTLFGAATAATAYTLFHKTPVVLAVFGFFFSMPCFYYIVAKPQYATTGRFVLLTYNLTCLFSFNSRQMDISVVDIAFHRSTAVTVGVVWAGLVSRFWWPSEARRELSKQLGDFCLNIGWLYTRLVASNSFSPENPMEVADSELDDPNEETALLLPRTLNKSVEEFMAMELHLQIKLIELQDLLKQTQHEPRLKGPFPVKLYRSILASLQTILDRLHSMRCVTTREEWYTSVRRDFILPVNKERREMVGNIILYFSTLASAFRFKAPLPPYLPPAEQARQQLVTAIRNLEVVKNREIKGSRQLLYFAYALTMQGITQELDFLGRTSQDAFGVIGQSTEVFENMFRDDTTSSSLV
ncbi:Fusaric acid resistance protein-like-domain-containing protein [Lactarius akahatsu]|uniref:Fusaric acid resistance protein-like-domain-containing protein n=1 Tax=Lactarius akahatsu TaxID=416441 RepID=A0AAD4LLG5_9AGAM|nr:Fusaric acid resistance protein-like-domain-containing protein [Lactarius akahatsu]